MRNMNSGTTEDIMNSILECDVTSGSIMFDSETASYYVDGYYMVKSWIVFFFSHVGFDAFGPQILI